MSLGHLLIIQLNKVFIGEKKKQLMFWQFFSFPIKVISKLSLNRFLTSALRALVSISLILL